MTYIIIGDINSYLAWCDKQKEIPDDVWLTNKTKSEQIIERLKKEKREFKIITL